MLILVAVALACPFRESLAAAQTAWQTGDYPAFTAAVDETEKSLSCLDNTPLTTTETATVHELIARRQWLALQEGKSGASFASVEWSLQGVALARPNANTPPPFDVDPALVAAWSRPLDPTCTPDLRLRRGRYRVDGVPENCLRANVAAVVQDRDDAAKYVLPGALPVEMRPATSWGWAAGALGTAALGTVALIAASGARDEFVVTEDDTLAAQLEADNLTFGVGGYVLLAAGAGLGTTAVLTGRW